MSHSSHSPTGSEPQVPTAMLKRHRADWHRFTRGLLLNCVVVGVVLVLMLVFLRVL